MSGKISKGLDKDMINGIILIKLQKAFNAIEHEVLS